ncbi:hypothetical protein LRY29_00385 [Candidatus Saccharibacteria bacterium]|nr:hypothetical protein [Candidatus Saccharibacteria bacterium]
MGHHTRQQLGSIIHDDGVDFAVWAPFAKDVILLVALDFDWKEYPMQADSKGYWHIEDVEASAGQSYQYRITAPTGRSSSVTTPMPANSPTPTMVYL